MKANKLIWVVQSKTLVYNDTSCKDKADVGTLSHCTYESLVIVN